MADYLIHILWCVYKPDDFDKLVKEMGMEMRAHAYDRVKGDEELAAEEKALLEELEVLELLQLVSMLSW